jgi:hypothetical protein
MKNPKLFRARYGVDEETLEDSNAPSASNTVVSLSKVHELISRQAKTSAIRQAFAMRSAAQGAIALQNTRPEIINGLLPLDQIGQRKISTAGVSGTMAVLAGGFYFSTTDANAEWSNYTNRMTEFLYVSQVFTPLTVTMSTPSRNAAASASNLVNSYFFGGYAGKAGRPNTVGFSFGTDTIDRYTRAAKSIVQIATKVATPWICYVSSSLTNLSKAIVPSGQRVSPRPAPWRTNYIDLGNKIYQYGDNTLKRFGYNGEDMQTISATLSQPRFGMSSLQGDKKTGYFFFGLNCYDLNKSGGIGGYDITTSFDRATQFDIDLETSSTIGEFRAHGVSRYGAGSASSKTNGYVFAGLDYTNQNRATLTVFTNSIFEFNFVTRVGTNIGTSLPENPATLSLQSLAYTAFQSVSSTASTSDAYVFKGNGNAPNSYIFNFGRKDLAPIATALVTQNNVRWNFFAAESDYNTGWGI